MHEYKASRPMLPSVNIVRSGSTFEVLLDVLYIQYDCCVITETSLYIHVYI